MTDTVKLKSSIHAVNFTQHISRDEALKNLYDSFRNLMTEIRNLNNRILAVKLPTFEDMFDQCSNVGNKLEQIYRLSTDWKPTQKRDPKESTNMKEDNIVKFNTLILPIANQYKTNTNYLKVLKTCILEKRVCSSKLSTRLDSIQDKWEDKVIELYNNCVSSLIKSLPVVIYTVLDIKQNNRYIKSDINIIKEYLQPYQSQHFKYYEFDKVETLNMPKNIIRHNIITSLYVLHEIVNHVYQSTLTSPTFDKLKSHNCFAPSTSEVVLLPNLQIHKLFYQSPESISYNDPHCGMVKSLYTNLLQDKKAKPATSESHVLIPTILHYPPNEIPAIYKTYSFKLVEGTDKDPAAKIIFHIKQFSSRKKQPIEYSFELNKEFNIFFKKNIDEKGKLTSTTILPEHLYKIPEIIFKQSASAIASLEIALRYRTYADNYAVVLFTEHISYEDLAETFSLNPVTLEPIFPKP